MSKLLQLAVVLASLCLIYVISKEGRCVELIHKGDWDWDGMPVRKKVGKSIYNIKRYHLPTRWQNG